MALPPPHHPPPLPDDQAWAALDVVVGQELHGGHQSRVFAAEHHGRAVAIKLIDRRFVDSTFEQRVELVHALAATNHDVVGPLPFSSGLMTAEHDGWFMTMYPFIGGRKPSIEAEIDVRAMAATLVRLHRSLAEFDPAKLPIVVPLRDVDLPSELSGPVQLLHGDFSDANTILNGDNAHVIDFDGCGHGPIEYEIGDTLYMALFDATIADDVTRYQRFRGWFVDEYRLASDLTVPDIALDAAILLRVRALERWLDQPETAPVGVRSASPEWHEMLRSFIRSALSD